MSKSNFPRLLAFCFTLAFVFAVAIGIGHAQNSTPTVMQVPSTGVSTFQPQAPGQDGVTSLEIDDLGQDADTDTGGDSFINRTLPSAGVHNGNPVHSGKKAKSNPQVNLAFDGLNFRQQRLANGGKQFSIEPPDQGLCAGNGYVLESTNDVLNVFDSSGNQLLGVTDLNSFYHYAPAIVRGSPNEFGPSVTDPSCIFDPGSQRWYHLVLTLERINVDANGQSTSQALSGLNHLDLAVSNTSNPLGTWTIYHIPVQDDGTQGTPNHNCPAAPGTPPAGRTNPHACLGDYPHLGADANGIYISTNEFAVFVNNFYNASQIYAVPKQELVSGLSSIHVFQYDTNDTPVVTPDFGPLPGFTVWPANAASAADYSSANGGTEYFLNTIAVFTVLDSRIALWAMTNTQALNSASAPTLGNTLINTVAYTNIPRQNQPGTGTNDQTAQWPLGQCLEDSTCAAFVQGVAAHTEKIGQMNANDSRTQQVMLANGKLWAAWGTGIVTENDASVHAGVVYLVATPQNTGALKAKIVQNGYIALDGVSLTYPTMAATSSGRGVVSFTYVGPNNFASVAYAPVDAIVGAGDVHVAQPGSGLQDGFTEYANVFNSRPRWGDYGAAAVDGNSIWFATEYINQSCDLTTYEAGFGSTFGSCGGTRASLGNWATRVTKVTP